MKKATVLVLVLCTLMLLGCNAQRKPAGQNPEQRLIPQESTIGFSQVDIDQLPAAIQKIASHMENRPMVTWAHDQNNSYILLNTGRDGETVKVNKVIQRVPVQDFLWLDVQLDYVDDEQGKKGGDNAKLVAVKLEKTDKAINGIGFEHQEKELQDKDVTPQAAPAPTPAPAPAPTPTPTPTREPANQARPAPENKAGEREPANKSAENGANEADGQKQAPTTPNDD